jgi:hypothetical protein
MPTSNRQLEWYDFALKVEEHVANYTVPQYGDYPTDQIATEFTIEDCFKHIQRYVNRNLRQNCRKDEIHRDLLKIAHYACVIAGKMERGEE